MSPLGRVRQVLARVCSGIARRLISELERCDGVRHASGLAERFDRVPKGQYDYVPKGKYVFGPADRFLLVPKNRYRVVLLPDQVKSAALGVGWLTEDNSSAGYDRLWGEKDNLEAFRTEADGARSRLTIEILDFVESRIPPSAEVVDIGCGVGDLLAEVRRRRPGVTISGLDFSSKAIEGAKAALPDGKFVTYAIDKVLPYGNGAFDVVLCTDVLEHLEFPKMLVAELVRICRPGGLLAIVVPDGDVDQFFGHLWFWNEESLRAVLADWNAEVFRLPQTREILASITPSA